MNIHSIYPAWDGEVNSSGIGAPTIFIRTQGCHLRCYLKTKGILCDSPEALEKAPRTHPTWMRTEDILQDVMNMTALSGIRKITFTGGDPLARPAEEINELFSALLGEGYHVTVETSGTLSIEKFRHWSHVSWILDYKLPSCGIEQNLVDKTLENFGKLRSRDFVKFVVEDWPDYEEMRRVVTEHGDKTLATLAVGPFWGGALSVNDLFQQCMRDGLLGRVVMNMQTHKMALQPIDHSVKIPVLY